MAGFGFEMIIWLFKKFVLKIKSFFKKDTYCYIRSQKYCLITYFFGVASTDNRSCFPDSKKGCCFPVFKFASGAAF